MSSSGLATEQVTDTTPLKVHRRVRWGECDPAGVVYTVNFCEYVASAFELFMAELLGGPLQTMKQRHGLATPARALTLEFTGPLRPDVRTRTFDLIIEGRSKNGRDIFRAKLTLIAVDPHTRVAIPIPGVLRERLDRYKGACASPS